MSVLPLLEQAQSLAPRIVELRRAIHAEPELGLDTPLTLAKARADLADLPLEWREGTSCTGAVATLRGARPGRSVLLRGDMDALPMPEETGLAFASTIPGRMHACGHDTHTAMLAGAAHLLAARQSEIAGEVRFMFQPGEEGYHGARFMLEEGLLGGLAHITGGGLIDNLPRVLPEGLAARIERSSWEIPPLFRVLQEAGGVEDGEMFRAFNMGVGMIVIVERTRASETVQLLNALGESAFELGTIQAEDGPPRVHLT